MELFVIGFLVLILAVIYMCYSLAQIRASLTSIQTIVEMSEQERHEYNLSIDEPEIYAGVMESKHEEQKEKSKPGA